MVVASEPPVPVLAHVGGVVAGLDVANVVDDGEQCVRVVTQRTLVQAYQDVYKIVISNYF